jgi:hypothetical protein
LWRVEDSIDEVEDLLEMNPTTFCALEKLDMAGCTQMGDYFLYQFAIRCPSLQFINLQDCYKISDAGVQALAQNCRNLTCYVLAELSSLTDASVLYITTYNKGLVEISLNRCGGISDAGVGFLMKGCPKLVNIDLVGCSQLTVHLLKEMKSYHRLEKLDLSFCYQMLGDFKQIEELMEASPHLKSISLWGFNFGSQQIENIRSTFPFVSVQSSHSPQEHNSNKRVKQNDFKHS